MRSARASSLSTRALVLYQQIASQCYDKYKPRSMSLPLLSLDSVCKCALLLMLWRLKARFKIETQAQIQEQWVEHYALSYSRWVLDFGSYLSVHVGYLAKQRSVRSSSCTKTYRNALSKQMTNVLETCRVKSEKSASQILLAPQCGMQKSDSGKMPNWWKFEFDGKIHQKLRSQWKTTTRKTAKTDSEDQSRNFVWQW